MTPYDSLPYRTCAGLTVFKRDGLEFIHMFRAACKLAGIRMSP